MATIKIKKLENFDETFPLPAYETAQAAGADLRASLPNKDKMLIEAGQRILIPTGLAFEIAEGYEVQIRPRSGLSLKTQLMIVNSPGTIDADYRGEVMIIMGNMGSAPAIIEHGDRVAQMVLAPITQAKFEVVDELSDTKRGTGGFGSTGKN